MAKTAAQRKREQRQRERESTLKDRVDVMIDVKGVNFLRAYSKYKGMPVADVVEEAINEFWRSMPSEMRHEMDAQQSARNEEKRIRQQGDTRTIPLFTDIEVSPSA